MVAKMVELRKGKMTEEQCRTALSQGQLLRHHAGEDGLRPTALLGGATYSTADTVRPGPAADQDQARQQDRVSSCFIMVRPAANGRTRSWRWADCAINIDPSEDEIVESTVETAHTAEVFGIDPEGCSA